MFHRGDFIPVFESNGFIIRLDYYVWDQVCQFIKNNLAHRGDSEVISVNVSRVNLYNPDFWSRWSIWSKNTKFRQNT